MLKTIALTLAMGALAALAIADARALPLASSTQTIESTDLSLVRDGCGRGMRFSRRAGGCVADDVVVAPRFIAPMVTVPSVRVCPYGSRWSNRYQQCV